MSFASTKSAGAVTRTAESELDTVLGLSENAFVVYDRAGTIRLVNERLRNLLELSDAEWGDLRDFSSLARILTTRLAHPQDRLDPPWMLWKAESGVGREQIALAARGRMLERIARPVYNASGGKAGWVERYRDASAERELPARLLQTDKLAAMGQLVAGIAHELNNPLTTLMGYGHLLLDRPLDPKSLADVHRICEETERAARIVRSLLMLAREAKPERIPVQLNEIIERTLWLCTYDFRRAGISPEVDLDPELPLALANPVQLQQIVLNLLVNAQQAIAESSRPGRIVLRTRHGADRVCLHVEDNGPGIPAELQSRIFEPFFTTKPMGVGTGLGLSIVIGILREHGGDIQVASVPGSGAAFTVTLPIAPAKPESLRAREESPRVSSPSRILVAEDEPGVAQLIADVLVADGHRVELVASGEEALDRVKRNPYDLVICDWRLRDLRGTELLIALEAANGGASSQLLVMTSDPSLCATPLVRNKNLSFLAKPFLLPELKGMVARLLAKRAHRSADSAAASVAANGD